LNHNLKGIFILYSIELYALILFVGKIVFNL
jgi:hypothetical protein